MSDLGQGDWTLGLYEAFISESGERFWVWGSAEQRAWFGDGVSHSLMDQV